MNKELKLSLKFLKYQLPYRKKQFYIFLLSSSSVLLSLVNPYLTKLIVDKGIINRQLKTFILLGLLGAVVFVLDNLVKAAANFLQAGLRLKLRFDLSKKVFTRLQGSSWSLFQNKSTGEHIFKLNYDIENAVDFMVYLPNELMNILPRLFLILAVIFWLSWQMAVFSLALVCILSLPVYYLIRFRRQVWQELAANFQNIFQRLGEIFSHIYLVKALGKEKREARSYLRSLLGNTKISLRSTKLEIFNSSVASGLSWLTMGLIGLFGGYQVIRAKISLGTLTAIMVYLTQLISLESNFIVSLDKITRGLVSCQRLDEVFTQVPRIEQAQNTRKIIFKEPKIQFQKVSFGYNPQEYILKGLDFSMEKGFIALVGPSGCGKTTILNLILRLYEPWEGEISIEGHNLRDIERYSFNSQLAIALQEPFLWNDSIENNIKYAKEGTQAEEIMAVAEVAGVDDFVKDLPQGYQTIIGENACKISEGQKQKIAIARALLIKPKILILDEAMSSMDSLSEERIIDRIKAMGIPLVIVVSHRLSTVMACDVAYFLKAADTLLMDKPSRLLEKDTAFSNLFSRQIR